MKLKCPCKHYCGASGAILAPFSRSISLELYYTRAHAARTAASLARGTHLGGELEATQVHVPCNSLSVGRGGRGVDADAEPHH